MTEVTKEILRFYHEIGHRDVLKYWRETVPTDVRKIWLRSFVTDVAKDKLLSEKYISLVERTLSPKTKDFLERIEARIRECQTHIDELAPQAKLFHENSEECFEIEAQIDIWDESRENAQERKYEILQKSLDTETLESFAIEYFTKFETDDEKQKIFEQIQQEASKILSEALSKEIPEIDAIVLVGSSALGKRTENHQTSQDLDFFFLPKETIPKQKLEQYKKLLYFLYLEITKQVDQYPEEYISEKEQEEFKRRLPN